MAQFTGNGSLIFGGTEQKVYDCEFVGTGDLVLNNTYEVEVRGCYFNGGLILDGAAQTRVVDNYFTGDPVTVRNNAYANLIEANSFDADLGIILDNAQSVSIVGNVAAAGLVEGNTTGPLVISGNVIASGVSIPPGIDVAWDGGNPATITDNALDGAGIRVDGSDYLPGFPVVISGNTLQRPDGHGIETIQLVRPVIAHNNIRSGTGDTFDGIHLDADTNGALVDHNQITVMTGGTLRYGINIAGGNDNIVVGNNLGAATDYDTAPIGDSGTGTVLTYPGGTYGDNFTL